MKFLVFATLALSTGVGAPALRAQSDPHAGHSPPDTGFAAMQRRGATAMGIDQYRSTHHFTPAPDGGTIELFMNEDDSAGTEQIRKHLREIAHAFSSGDFSTPMFVHMRTVPGTAQMAAKRSVINYTVVDEPRGGRVRIKSGDSSAVAAIHEFLAFQRSDHHATSR